MNKTFDFVKKKGLKSLLALSLVIPMGVCMGNINEKVITVEAQGFSAISSIKMIASDGVTLGQTGIVRSDNSLWTTGDNQYGNLGLGDTNNRNVFTLAENNVEMVAMGNYHTIILKTDGTVWTTGKNTSGELGTGDNVNRSDFVQVGSNAKSVIAGSSTSYYITNDNKLYGTGYNGNGSLGDKTTINKNTFTYIMSDVKQCVSDAATLVLKTDGTVLGTGFNAWGGLGDKTYVQKNEFIKLFDNAIQVAVGDGSSGVILADNSLYMSGSNELGKLGINSTVNTINTFQKVATNVKKVVIGDENAAYLTTDNDVYSTGSGTYGANGDGTTNNYNYFIKVNSDVKNIYEADYGLFLLKNNGSILTTGKNSNGGLGTGDTTNRYSFTPVFTNLPTITSTNNDTSWKNKPHTETITFSDDGTITSKLYAWSNTTTTPTNWTNYTGTVTQPGEGEYYLHVKATDNMSNIVQGYFGPYQYEKTIPTASTSQSTSAWTINSVTLNISSILDTGGSEYKYTLLPDGTLVNTTEISYSVSKNGIYEFTIFDNAGNTIKRTFNVTNIDTTKPNGNVVYSTTSPTNKDVVVSLTASDLESGIKEIELPNGGIINSNTITYNVTENGVYTFKVRDIANNESTIVATVGNIDKVLPNGKIEKVAEEEKKVTVRFTYGDE